MIAARIMLLYVDWSLKKWKRKNQMKMFLIKASLDDDEKQLMNSTSFKEMKFQPKEKDQVGNRNN